MRYLILALAAACSWAGCQAPTDGPYAVGTTQPVIINVYLTLDVKPGAVVLQVQPGAVDVGGVGPITVNASLLPKAMTRPATEPAEGE